MIEAMSCGTPVIAYPRGSIPELVEDGASGFIVRNIPHAAKAVSRAAALSRQPCREYFEQRFSSARMCEDYLEVYKSLLAVDRESIISAAFPRIPTSPPSRIPPTTVGANRAKCSQCLGEIQINARRCAHCGQPAGISAVA